MNKLLVLAFSALCLTMPISAGMVEAATSQTAVVTGSYVNLRSGPGTNHATQGQVVKGDKLVVLSKQGDWYQIKKTNGQTAWIANWLVEVETIPAPTTTETAVIIGTNVNLRSGPGTTYPVQGQLNQGDKLPILAKQGDWLKLKNSDGKEVWLAAWLVKVESAAPTSVPSKLPTNSSAPTPTTNEMAIVTGTNVNLRVGPGTSYPIQGQAMQGDKLIVLGKQAGWLKLKDSDGKEVWLAEWLAKVEKVVITAPQSTVKNLEPNQTMTPTSPPSSNVGSRGDGIERDSNLWLPKPSDVNDNNDVADTDSVVGKVIFIDAGHGGNDPGAPGYSRNTWEEDANLDMALKLADILAAQGAQVEMSRTSDETVDLSERPNMANKINADIFVSVHSNANNNSDLQGTSTYFYAPSSSPDLYAQRDDRQRLAQNIQNEMVEHANLSDKNIREANFAVLRESKMPSVLVETAYISNPEEEKLLADNNFRQRVAEAIARGINAYFSGN